MTDTPYYLDEVPGFDSDRDHIRVALDGDTGVRTDINVEEIGGQAQSAVDVANLIDEWVDALEGFGGSDEVRTRLYAEDDGSNLAAVQAEELGTALGGTETAIVTRQSQALDAIGNDEVRSRIYGDDVGGNTAAVQAEEIDTGISGVETGIVGYSARALKSTGPLDEVGVSPEDAGITTPVDVQEALEKTTENYGADNTAEQQEKLQKDGYTTVDIVVNPDTDSQITIETSWDDSNFFEIPASPIAAADYSGQYYNTFESSAKYVRVTVAGNGGGSDTVDIVIGAAP